jgi:hypothetical protein
MAKGERPTLGIDGTALPLLPPDRDPRVWARLVRVMFYTPGFLALLLIKAGDPTSFGIAVELLMLASAAAVVGGLFIGTQPIGGADNASRAGVWSGALVIELLSVVPFLCAVPSLFHELATSALFHARAPEVPQVPLGASEMIPAVAILPFMIYQLAGFGTLHYVVSRMMNVVINVAVLVLIVASYVANRLGGLLEERMLSGLLVIAMAATVFYGVMKLKRMQAQFDARAPRKVEKEKKDKKKSDAQDEVA